MKLNLFACPNASQQTTIIVLETMFDMRNSAYNRRKQRKYLGELGGGPRRTTALDSDHMCYECYRGLSTLGGGGPPFRWVTGFALFS